MALGRAQQMVSGALPPAQFLATLPADMLESVIDACARIAFSRRDALYALKLGLHKPAMQGLAPLRAP
jgi:hypothetical protein